MMRATARRPRSVTPVGILAERLTRLCGRAGDLPAEVAEELHACRSLAAGLEPYTADCTSPESPALAQLAARTRERDWERREQEVVAVEQEMLSGHVEGKVLQFLVGLCRARRALEIGTFTGYGSLAIAESLGVDGRLITCERDPEVAQFARRSLDESPAGARVEIRVGPALDTLAELAAEGLSFDFVFLDADKTGYTDYVHALLDLGLLTEHALVCVDNTLLQGEPWLPQAPSANGSAIACFNATIVGDPRLEQVLLPVRDGITLIRRVAGP